MKIALTHMRHAQVGGTERFLNQISLALIERGHDVTIVCRSHEAPVHPDTQFVTLNPVALGRGHRLWRFAKDVERHVRSHDYDLVFGLGRTWSQDVLRVGGGLYRDQIGMGLGRRRYWPKDLVAEAIERRSFAPGCNRMVIANSHLTERALIEQYHLPDEQVVTIHNAVDVTHFNPSLREQQGRALRQQCGFTEQHLVYLFLGSGYRRKGLNRLLEAFRQVVARQPRARLMVVGYDNHPEEYKTRVEQLGLVGKVVFLGGRRDAEVCYNAADCYVLPTRFDAFGFSVLEALACGLPVVVTDTAGAAEVVTDTVGSIVHGDDEIQIIGKLAQALLLQGEHCREPERRQSARNLALDYATEPVMARNIDVLERIAREKSCLTADKDE